MEGSQRNPLSGTGARRLEGPDTHGARVWRDAGTTRRSAAVSRPERSSIAIRNVRQTSIPAVRQSRLQVIRRRLPGGAGAPRRPGAAPTGCCRVPPAGKRDVGTARDRRDVPAPLSALSYSRSTMLAGRCEIDRNRVADPIIATGDDRDAALQRNCAFPLALRHSSGRTACRPIAYPDPARRTTIWAASSKRS